MNRQKRSIDEISVSSDTITVKDDRTRNSGAKE